MTRAGGVGRSIGSEHRHLLVIGGQRCGTTWLHEVLASHPEVRPPVSLRPEPKFFLDDDDHDRYDALFPSAGGRFLLDKSTTYLERGDAARRALACVPESSVIAVVRDPVARAYSNWRFSVVNGLENLSFAESLADRAQLREWNGLSTSPYQSLRRGRYAELLRPWSEAFGSQLVVLQYERMTAADGGGYVAERLAGLGIESPEGWPLVPPPANAAPHDRAIAVEEHTALRTYYAEVNAPLTAYGVDLGLWTS
jgi:hypothetical protein